MEIEAKHKPEGELLPGEYRLEEKGDRLAILFRLPEAMEAEANYKGSLHTVPLGGSYWTLVSRDPITITPSIWYNRGMGKAKGEWHGFITNGKFVQV